MWALCLHMFFCIKVDNNTFSSPWHAWISVSLCGCLQTHDPIFANSFSHVVLLIFSPPSVVISALSQFVALYSAYLLRCGKASFISQKLLFCPVFRLPSELSAMMKSARCFLCSHHALVFAHLTNAQMQGKDLSWCCFWLSLTVFFPSSSLLTRTYAWDRMTSCTSTLSVAAICYVSAWDGMAGWLLLPLPPDSVVLSLTHSGAGNHRVNLIGPMTPRGEGKSVPVCGPCITASWSRFPTSVQLWASSTVSPRQWFRAGMEGDKLSQQRPGKAKRTHRKAKPGY